METPKYYTPTIEEFVIGLPYEIKIGDVWIMFVYDEHSTINTILFSNWTDTIPTIKEKIKKEECRVKCLDYADVESLGWSKTNLMNVFVKTDRTIVIKLMLRVDNRIEINVYSTESEGFNSRIVYKIKNKIELQKLMYQLNRGCLK